MGRTRSSGSMHLAYRTVIDFFVSAYIWLDRWRCAFIFSFSRLAISSSAIRAVSTLDRVRNRRRTRSNSWKTFLWNAQKQKKTRRNNNNVQFIQSDARECVCVSLSERRRHSGWQAFRRTKLNSLVFRFYLRVDAAAAIFRCAQFSWCAFRRFRGCARSSPITRKAHGKIKYKRGPLHQNINK